MVAFEATKPTLQETLDALQVILDEAVLEFGESQVAVNGVDPADVAMVDLELTEDAFESYDADQTRAGVNLDRFADIVGMGSSTDVISYEEADTGRVLVTASSIEYTMALIDPESVRTGRDIPDAAWDAEATIDAATLKRGATACDMVSDYLRLRVTDGELHMSAEGDTDSVTLNTAEEEAADVDFSGTPSDCESTFSLDYVKSVLKAIPNGASVDLAFGDEFPVVLSFDIADGAGAVTYAVAPRIES